MKKLIVMLNVMMAVMIGGCGNTMAENSVSDEKVAQNTVELEPTIEVTKVIEQPTEEPKVEITQIPESDATESQTEISQKVTPQEGKNTPESQKETITPEPVSSSNNADAAPSESASLEEGEASDSRNSEEADKYVGEYKDYDNDEVNLWISKNEDGTYHIEIGIYRLASFEDGVGKITDSGLEFTTLAPNGTPIKGIISIDGEIATVTFKDSDWSLIENGQAFQYHR